MQGDRKSDCGREEEVEQGEVVPYVARAGEGFADDGDGDEGELERDEEKRNAAGELGIAFGAGCVDED